MIHLPSGDSNRAYQDDSESWLSGCANDSLNLPLRRRVRPRCNNYIISGPTWRVIGKGKMKLFVNDGSLGLPER